MKKFNGKVIDFILSIIHLYCRKKTIVTCDGYFIGFAYGEYPLRRYLWTGILLAMVIIGLIMEV